MARLRHIAWIASGALHLTAAAAVLTGLPAPPAEEAMPVMLLEMPVPTAPEPEPEPVPEPQAMAAPAPTPPAEAPPDPPPPQVVETPPEPPAPVAAVEPPPPEPPPPVEQVAELPIPPPPPPPAPVVRQPVTPPRRPPPRPPVANPTQTMAEAAPAPPAAAPVAARAPVAAAPSPSYAAQLMRALERHRRYPDEARWRRAEGVALLRFRMSRDGTVTGFRIERSTGDAALDQAVQTMIQNASPLPAPPDDLPGNPVELTVPVRFTLR